MLNYQRPLLEFISATKGERADAALILFLSDQTSYMRGYAASSVGERGLRSAVHIQIKLLDDKEIYISVSCQDCNKPDKPILVRDNAIDALELIVGKSFDENKSQERQAEAWLDWWRKQKEWNSLVGCKLPPNGIRKDVPLHDSLELILFQTQYAKGASFISQYKYIGMDAGIRRASPTPSTIHRASAIARSIIETRAETVRDFVRGLSGTLHVTFDEGSLSHWLYDLIRPFE